ncbi:TPA: glycerate kinase [Enterococcus faecium]|nr:glycerate kinase [Enterococcus faecium]
MIIIVSEGGIDYVLDIVNEPMVLSYAMELVERLLVCAGEQAMRLVQLSEKTRN